MHRTVRKPSCSADSMQPRTGDYLRTADRNRDVARELAFAPFKTPPSDWAAVIAFYAALHFMHAYLFERENGREPTSHKDRRNCMETVAGLMPAEDNYNDLYDLSVKVRYRSLYRINGATVQEALDNMGEVERVVRKGLGA